MLEKSLGVMFYLKPSRKTKDDLRYIYLRITVESKISEISTKRMWDRNRWNSQSGRAVGKTEDVRELNSFLDSFQTKVFQAKKILLEKDMSVSAENIKDILTGRDKGARFILEVFEDHNKKMEALVGNEFAPGTLERYKTSLEHTRSFIMWKYQKQDIELKKLDYEFIAEYSFWFKSIRKCSHNTTVKYLSNFKKIVLSCVKSGWLDKDPFYGFKMVKKEVERPYLTGAELQEIIELKTGIERIDNVRDIFVFSCFTGLAYIDVKNLTMDNITEGIDGKPWIITRRQKTETPTRIPLLPQALRIMDKYKNHRIREIKGSVLPVLSNQKMNAYLKEIADLCGINKQLTFHTARHTFATSVTLENGVPIETVAKLLGHKSLKQTMHYARVIDSKISSEMEMLSRKLKVKNEASIK